MNPFPGLRPFDAAEAALFTGRDLALRDVANHVRIAPLTVLFARSGVGKSSFLRCRLIPELRAESPVVYANEWGGRSPAQVVGELIASAADQAPGGRELPVLVLDQFEDVFKLGDDPVFLWEVLAEAFNVDAPRIHVLICIREEWLGAWSEVGDYIPRAMESLVRLNPLSESELSAAIIKPAEIGGVTMTPALADAILSDLRRSYLYGADRTYVEPGLVQLVCRRLWQEASDQKRTTVDVNLYQDLGGADRLVEEFVWQRLGREKRHGGSFTAEDRVLWAGVTNQLVIGTGIKAIVSAEGLSRKLHAADLGLDGNLIWARLPASSRRYLMRPLGKRDDQPPPDLVARITRVLETAVAADLVKRHGRGEGGVEAMGDAEPHYELIHDELGEMLQRFAADFKEWIFGRSLWWRRGFAGVLSALIVLLISYLIHRKGESIPADIIGAMFLVGIYLGFDWGLKFLGAKVGSVALRGVLRGDIPLSAPKQRQKRGGRTIRSN